MAVRHIFLAILIFAEKNAGMPSNEREQIFHFGIYMGRYIPFFRNMLAETS